MSGYTKLCYYNQQKMKGNNTYLEILLRILAIEAIQNIEEHDNEDNKGVWGIGTLGCHE